MDLQFSGRIAIVSGASKGIGLAVTRTLLDEGAKVLAPPVRAARSWTSSPVRTWCTSPRI